MTCPHDIEGTKSSVLKSAIPYTIVFILMSIFYFPLLFGKGILRMGDYIDQNIPNFIYMARCLRAGFLPYWTTNLFGGYPYLSDPQTSVFYLPHIILAFLFNNPGTSFIMDRFIFVHWLCIAFGGVYLARVLGIGRMGSVVSGIINGINGYIILHSGHTQFVEVMAMGIWSVSLLIKGIQIRNYKFTVASGLCLSSIILVGHPQMSLYIFYMIWAVFLPLLFMGVIQNRAKDTAFLYLKRFVICGIVTLMGSAVLPLLSGELLINSHREFGNMTLDVAAMYSLPLKQLPGLLFPHFYYPIVWNVPSADRWINVYNSWGAFGAWEYMFYLGISAFALALLGWFSNFKKPLVQYILWISVLIVVESLGKEGRLFPILYKYLPGFNLVRVPPRLMWIAFLIWGILAGLGIDAITKRAKDKDVRISIIATFFVLIAIWFGMVGVLLFKAHGIGNWTEALKELLLNNKGYTLGVNLSKDVFLKNIFHQWILSTIITVILCLWLIFSLGRRKGNNILASLIVGIVFLEFGIYGFHKNIRTDTKEPYQFKDEVYLSLPEKPEGRINVLNYNDWHFRINCNDRFFGKNSALVADIDYVKGYNPMMIKWIAPFIPPDKFSRGSRDAERNLNIWNVTHLVYPKNSISVNFDEKAFSLPDADWVKIDNLGKDYRDTLRWRVKSGAKIKNVYLFSSAYYAIEKPDGYEAARFIFYDDAQTTISTSPVRLGFETSEWSYDNPGNTVKPAHRKIATAFMKDNDEAGWSKMPIYVAPLVIEIPGNARYIECRLTAGNVCGLAVSHLALEHDAGYEILMGIEGIGYEAIKSKQNGFSAIKREGALGKAWFVPMAESVSYENDFREVLNIYHSADFDPRVKALLNSKQISEKQCADLSAANNKNNEATLDYRRPKPHIIKIKSSTERKGWLVISESFYPGWRATVDGNPVEIFQANGNQMALPLSSGKHDVEIKFRQNNLLLGLTLTITTWILSLLYIIFSSGFMRIKKRQRLCQHAAE